MYHCLLIDLFKNIGILIDANFFWIKKIVVVYALIINICSNKSSFNLFSFGFISKTYSFEGGSNFWSILFIDFIFFSGKSSNWRYKLYGIVILSFWKS